MGKMASNCYLSQDFILSPALSDGIVIVAVSLQSLTTSDRVTGRPNMTAAVIWHTPNYWTFGGLVSIEEACWV